MWVQKIKKKKKKKKSLNKSVWVVALNLEHLNTILKTFTPKKKKKNTILKTPQEAFLNFQVTI